MEARQKGIAVGHFNVSNLEGEVYKITNRTIQRKRMKDKLKELFPEAQVTIGPVVENGFYYDFEFESPISDKDLKDIEKNKLIQILYKWLKYLKQFRLIQLLI